MTPPASHGSVTSDSSWSSVGEGRMAIAEALLLLGLTADEAAAFQRAWDPTLFAGGGEPALRLDLAATIPTLDESIFYFLPPELTEHIATLDFDPPPAEVRRAMGVWTGI